MPVRQSLVRACRTSLAAAALAAVVGFVGGCAGGDANRGNLRAPEAAVPFESRYAVAFDDGYTAAPPQVEGRAPNDVMDQRLLHARLGHADLVVLVEVAQIWEKGFKGGDKRQYLDVELGEVLLGDLASGVRDHQMLAVAGDPVPTGLEGQRLLMFVRWAPGEEPSFHHHLGPAVPELVEMIRAMVKHARKEGVLTASGEQKAPRK